MGVIKAQATVCLDRKLGTIRPSLYGTTWDWRDAHSGGIWVGDDSAIPNVHGFRKDAIDALVKLALPIIQFFPQSPFYRWEDGVGPRGVPQELSVFFRAFLMATGLLDHSLTRGCQAPLLLGHAYLVPGMS